MNTLELYLLVNLALVVAYAAFRTLRAATAKNAPPALAAKAGLALMAAGVFAPLVIDLVPDKSLPSLPAVIRQPLAETSRPWRARKHRQKRVAPKTAPQTAHEWTPPEVRWDLLGEIAEYLLLLGTAAFVARSAASWGRLRKLTREAALIRSVGRVRIRVSPDVDVPLSAMGFSSWTLTADVLLPENLIGRPVDLAIAIRHELQHHRQGDTLSALVLEAVGAFFFINPAVHAFRRELADLQEFACDEAVLGQRKVSAHAYGSCLVRVAEAALGSRVVHAGTACMARPSGNPDHFKSILRMRVERVLNMKSQMSRSRLPIVILGTLGALATTAVALGAQQSIRAASLETRTANPGALELNPALQKIAEEALSRHLKQHKAGAGFVIVSEPASGRILAVAESGKGARWALSYRMEPASIMKPIVAASAVMKKATTLDEKHDCEEGEYRLGNHLYQDWSKFDELTTAETIIKSSNICGIKIGEELGAQGLSQALTDFGIGPGGSAEQLPEARPGEFPAAGELPRAEYIPMISTGYSAGGTFYVTPIEMVQAYGAFANGGLLMKPIAGTTAKSVVLRRVLDEDTAESFREVLERSVLEGTGKNAKSTRYTTAGKTSSAYSPLHSEHDKLGGEGSVAGFIGFAPADEPRLLVYAAVFDPKDQAPKGNFHAAPLFRDVIEGALRQLGVAPDR